MSNSFLYPHQERAVNRMFSGCILNGGTGSGKSRTGLYYFFTKNGGRIGKDGYSPMRYTPDLYIITTAKKKNNMEWEEELNHFLLSSKPSENYIYTNRIVIDSWNCIQKYADVKNAQFIFDEDKVCGKGVWVKAFLKIAKNNEWIILSATPGDTWVDYVPVFIANGFYKNRTEFNHYHVIFSRYTKYPKIDGYMRENYLLKLRDKILIDMDFDRHTTQHHEDVFVQFDVAKYKDAIRKRWDPYKDEPITQASGLCTVLRRIVNEHESRQVAVLELLEDHPRAVIFYNFNYELDILLNLAYIEGTKVAQYNGHIHDPVPTGDRWVYLVQYSACEGWNLTTTDTMIFYSQNYSYKILNQASGRIDRLNTPYTDLYYYHLRSRSGIDLAITKAIQNKKVFNERKFVKWE